MNTVFEELLNWKHKKKIQFDLIYRYAHNKSDVIEKKFIIVKIIFIIITYNDKTLNNKFINLVEVLISSNFIKRLLSVQVAKNKINFIIIIKCNIRVRWKCVKKNYDN